MQLVHFKDITPMDLTTGEAEAAVGIGVVNDVLVPHLTQTLRRLEVECRICDKTSFFTLLFVRAGVILSLRFS
jgi:hypothetical protein